MTRQHGLFLGMVLALSLIEALFLYFMMNYTAVAKDPRFVLVMALVGLILIPCNIFVAWKLIMRPQKPE